MNVPINCTQPANDTIAAECSHLTATPHQWAQAENTTMADYLNKSSVVYQRVAKAANARAGWHALDVDTCRRQYVQCGIGSGIQKYRDVLIIFEQPVQ